MTTQIHRPAATTPLRLRSVLAGAGIALAPLVLLVGMAATTLGAAPTPDSPAPAGPPSSGEVLAGLSGR